MTPAANEKRLAGKWIVWWKHESRPVVDKAGKLIRHDYPKVWRHDRVNHKLRDGWLRTYDNTRLHVTENVFVVDGEIADWPRFVNPDGARGARRAITQVEFDDLTSSRP